MLGKYGSSPCKVDGDCQLVFENNACVSNCGEALPVSTAGFFETNIAGDAQACNMACPGFGGPPPCLQQVAVCSNGTCTALPAGGVGGGVGAACMKARATYNADRTALLAKLSSAHCNQDTDCALQFESNACVTNCGEALTLGAADTFTAAIQQDSDACDATCPPLPLPPCAALGTACVNGVCTTTP
jgi:hypothetical protein